MNGGTMRKFVKINVAFTTFALVLFLSAAGYAASYADKVLTHIAMNADGTVFIRWAGSPRPSPSCNAGGDNFGWVKIRPTANEAIKALALSIYFSGKLARIDTSGCDGPYEIVTSLYSPAG